MVKDLELHIQSISIVYDSCLSPVPTPSPSTSRSPMQYGSERTSTKTELSVTPQKPKSAKKILVDGLGDIIVALQGADLDD